MATKRFLVSVADAVLMQGNNIILTAKTMLDSSVGLSTNNIEIHGGVSNPLQAVFYHTAAMNITLTESQFRLPFMALNVGSSITAGGDIWTNETVTLSGTTGSLTGVPTRIANQDLSVWTEYNDTWLTLPVTAPGEGTNDPYTFSTSGTAIPSGSTLCVSYVYTNTNGKTIVVPANFVPDRARLYLTANLYGDTTGAGFIGKITIEIPSFQLSGAQDISMTADGYSNTPLTGMAVAYSDSSTVGCGMSEIYARITETLNSGNWYDNATALAIDGGDFSMSTSGTHQIKVWYVENGRSYAAPVSDLTFSCTPTTSASVGAHTGLVTSTSSAGTGTIKVVITNKPEIEATCTVTVAS